MSPAASCNTFQWEKNWMCTLFLFWIPAIQKCTENETLWCDNGSEISFCAQDIINGGTLCKCLTGYALNITSMRCEGKYITVNLTDRLEGYGQR